jgi:hypothetical protein
VLTKSLGLATISLKAAVVRTATDYPTRKRAPSRRNKGLERIGGLSRRPTDYKKQFRLKGLTSTRKQTAKTKQMIRLKSASYGLDELTWKHNGNISGNIRGVPTEGPRSENRRGGIEIRI